MNNLITALDSFDESMIDKFHDRQLVFIKDSKDLYMKYVDKDGTPAFIDLLADIKEELLQMPFRTHLPDYSKLGESGNKFDGSNSWKSDQNGWILIIMKGMGSYDIKVQGASILKKSSIQNEPDTEYLFSHAWPINIDDTIEITYTDTPGFETFKGCYFMPLKVGGLSTEVVVNEKRFVDIVHPIGSLYFTTNPTNPKYLFPNTEWERFSQGRVIIGANIDNINDDQTKNMFTHNPHTHINTINDIGGKREVQLSISEMPTHNHESPEHFHDIPNHDDHNNHPNHQDNRYHKHTLGMYSQNIPTYNYNNTYTTVLVPGDVNAESPNTITTDAMYRGNAFPLSSTDKVDPNNGGKGNDINNTPIGTVGVSDYSHNIHGSHSEHKTPSIAIINEKGGSIPHDNIQPYILCFIWRRKN